MSSGNIRLPLSDSLPASDLEPLLSSESALGQLGEIEGDDHPRTSRVSRSRQTLVGNEHRSPMHSPYISSSRPSSSFLCRMSNYWLQWLRLHSLVRQFIFMLLMTLLLMLPWIIGRASGHMGSRIYGLSFANWSLFVAFAFLTFMLTKMTLSIVVLWVRLYAGHGYPPMWTYLVLRGEHWFKWFFWFMLLLILWDAFTYRDCPSYMRIPEPPSPGEAHPDGDWTKVVQSYLFGSSSSPSFVRSKANTKLEAGQLSHTSAYLPFISTDEPGLEICALSFIRRLMICAIVTCFGLLCVKVFVLALSIRYQERVYREKIMKNRYDIYVADQLYQFCRHEEARRMERESDHEARSARATIFPPLSPTMETLDELDQNHASSSVLNWFRSKWHRIASAFAEPSPDVESGLNVGPSISSSLSSFHIMPQHEYRRHCAKGLLGADFALIDTDFHSPSSGINASLALVATANDVKVRGKFIFDVLRSLAGESNRSFLTIHDMEHVLKATSVATDVFNVFDMDQDGRLSRLEFKQSMLCMYREHKNIMQSVQSSGEALRSLDNVLSVTLFVVLALVYLIIFGVQVQSLLTLALSMIIALNFMIGNTAKNMFDSMVLMFVNHPFDVGDKVMIQGTSEVYTVYRIHILRSHFLDPSGSEIYFPNHILLKLFILNLSRSHEQTEEILISIDLSTSESLLSELRNSLLSFLQSNPQYFYHKLELETIPGVSADLERLPLRVQVLCKATQESSRKAERRRSLLSCLKTLLERLHINYKAGRNDKSHTEIHSGETSSKMSHGTSNSEDAEKMDFIPGPKLTFPAASGPPTSVPIVSPDSNPSVMSPEMKKE